MGYIYQADVYCEDCGKAIRAQLRAEGKAPEDEMDHRSYDSDDYPKDADVEREEADSPQHCGQCREFLHNPLTSDGYRYVKRELDATGAIKPGKLSEVLQKWASWYNFDYWSAEDLAENYKQGEPGWFSQEAY